MIGVGDTVGGVVPLMAATTAADATVLADLDNCRRLPFPDDGDDDEDGDGSEDCLLILA